MQSEAGYWDPTPGLAFALYAHQTRPQPQQPSKGGKRDEEAKARKSTVMAAFHAMFGGEDDGGMDGEPDADGRGFKGGVTAEDCPLTGASNNRTPFSAHRRAWQRVPRKPIAGTAVLRVPLAVAM